MNIVTRTEAKAAGLKKYFTGKPCKHGHVAERYVAGDCTVCAQKKQKEWDAKHPETQRLKTKKWASKNRASISARERKNYAAAPERWAVRARKWRAENPEVVAASKRNRRARESRASGSHTSGDVARILGAQRFLCPYCLADLRTVKRHVDHILPLALGGANDPTNLQLLCQPCNNKKHAKHPVDFAQARGFLL